MQKVKLILTGILIFVGAVFASAQTLISVPLPEVTVWANKGIQGDSDIYGLGTWSCHIRAKIMHKQVILEGKIVFTEDANDFTVIVGYFTKTVSMIPCLPSGEWAIEPAGNVAGIVGGDNMGASGFHWFEGAGLIQHAHIITDTFGADTGNIGGTIKLKPLLVRISPVYASGW